MKHILFYIKYAVDAVILKCLVENLKWTVHEIKSSKL